MKKRLSFLALIAVVVLFIYFLYKPQYLNLEFADPSGPIEVARVMVTSGVNLKGDFDKDSSGHTVITSKVAINKIIDYLNSIPLTASSEEEFPENHERGAFIQFYDENGITLGWVSVRGEEYVLRGRDMKAFKVRNKDIRIVSGLEELEF